MATGAFCARRACPPAGSKRSLHVPPCRPEEAGLTRSRTAAALTSEEVDKSESGERLVPKFLLCNVEVNGEALQSVKGFCSGEVARSMEAGLGSKGRRGEESSCEALRKPAASTESSWVSVLHRLTRGCRDKKTLDVRVPDSKPVPACPPVPQVLLSSTPVASTLATASASGGARCHCSVSPVSWSEGSHPGAGI